MKLINIILKHTQYELYVVVEPGFQFRRGNIGSKINPKNINLTLIKVKKIYNNVIIVQNVL